MSESEARHEPPEREGIYWGGDERFVDELFVVGHSARVVQQLWEQGNWIADRRR